MWLHTLELPQRRWYVFDYKCQKNIRWFCQVYLKVLFKVYPVVLFAFQMIICVTWPPMIASVAQWLTSSSSRNATVSVRRSATLSALKLSQPQRGNSVKRRCLKHCEIVEWVKKLKCYSICRFLRLPAMIISITKTLFVAKVLSILHRCYGEDSWVVGKRRLKSAARLHWGEYFKICIKLMCFQNLVSTE